MGFLDKQGLAPLQRDGPGLREGGKSWQTEGCFHRLLVGGEIGNFG